MIDNLFFKQTESSPEIIFNAQTGILSINGKSFPENAFDFYSPIIQGIETYFNENSAAEIEFNFKPALFFVLSQ